MKEMEKRLRLAEHGKHLWTRELARSIREQLESVLQALPEGGVLVLDLKGVEVFDYSFANELFGKTVLRLSTEYPGRFVLVEGLTAYARENLEKALEALKLAMIERKGTSLRLIGKVHATDTETFKALCSAKAPVSAATLASKLGVALTTMNERLSKLSELSLVRRVSAVSDAGREQYEYSVLK